MISVFSTNCHIPEGQLVAQVGALFAYTSAPPQLCVCSLHALLMSFAFPWGILIAFHSPKTCS